MKKRTYGRLIYFSHAAGRAWGIALLGLILAACAARSFAAEALPIREQLRATPFKIAFEAYVGGDSKIFIMNADGSEKVKIDHVAGTHEHYPQISPDGTKICFTIDVGEGRQAVRSLWLMDIDGKNRRKIADHAREPFWSPDGALIGYLPQEYDKFDVVDFYTKGMIFYHLDTGKSEPHPNSDKLRHLYHPRFSPNGKWIVSTVHGGMGFSHAILAIEAHGNRIINLNIPGCRPTVCPDGKHIAWGSDDHQLNSAPVDFDSDTPTVGGWDFQIKDPKNKIYHIAWSPDGKFVAFSRGPDGEGDLTKAGTFQAACEIIGVYAKDWNLYAVSAKPRFIDLSNATDVDLIQLTTDGCSNKEPAWFTAKTHSKE